MRECPVAPAIQIHEATPKPPRAFIDPARLMDCIHCGICLSQCPTYAEEMFEADSPRGRIYLMRALTEGRTTATTELVGHLDSCLGCRACETACPSGVQYGHLLEGTREYLRENYRRPFLQRLIGGLVERTFPYPNRLEAALLPVRLLRRTGLMSLLHRIGFMKLLGGLGEMEAMLPALPPMSKRLRFPPLWHARGKQQASVGMITGCVMQVMLSPVNEATARVLSRAGCSVAAPRDQVCCGALHAHIGAMPEARALAKTNIAVFESWQQQNGELDAIIINAAGCGSALKEYGHWLKDDPAWSTRAAAFAAKVQDVSQFLDAPDYKTRLTALMDTQPGPPVINLPYQRMTYHDACHLAHGQGIRAAPRDLMALLPDKELVPLPESEMCCGSAGIYNITQPVMAGQLLERKLANIKSTGADVVVSSNPGCTLQLQYGMRKHGLAIAVMHPVQLLDRATAVLDSSTE